MLAKNFTSLIQTLIGMTSTRFALCTCTYISFFLEFDFDSISCLIFKVGLRNVYICCCYAARLMIKCGNSTDGCEQRARGLIVNISSAGGLKYAFSVAYGVGKAAVDRMSTLFCRIYRPSWGYNMSAFYFFIFF